MDALDASRQIPRLLSFREMPWRPSPLTPSPEALASAGLHAAPRDKFLDGVECYCCDLFFAEWDSDDDPMLLHRTASPNCSLVKYLRSLSGLARSFSLLQDSIALK